MQMTTLPLSTEVPAGLQNLTEREGVRTERDGGAEAAGTGIIAVRWPTLGRAMGRYERRVAEEFSTMAYEAVEGGIIRQEARRRLAAAGEALGIKAFDAQLLIACAVRQWAMDRRYDASPRPDAPVLSFEHQSWGRMWVRFGILVGTAVALDAVFLWKWLG